MDIDRDGKISKEEWIAAHGSEKGFAEHDLNVDGFVDEEEYCRVEMTKASLLNLSYSCDWTRSDSSLMDVVDEPSVKETVCFLT